MIAKIDPEVARIIAEFVEKGGSFISLDIYCKLGIHFNDSDNPICEQVRNAYGSSLMPNYLCKWVGLKLEGGGFANVWKYYLPSIQTQTYPLRVRTDGRVELTKKILGSFSLLECDLGCSIEAGKITFSLCDGAEEHIVNASNRILISPNVLKTAQLHSVQNLKATVYPNKVEIVGN